MDNICLKKKHFKNDTVLYEYHSSKDFGIHRPLCQWYLSIGILPSTLCHTLSMPLHGFIHAVPATAGFLSKQGVHAQISTVATSNQASAFSFALRLLRQRLLMVSQSPIWWELFSFLLFCQEPI